MEFLTPFLVVTGAAFGCFVAGILFLIWRLIYLYLKGLGLI